MKIVFNGKEYASAEAMPADERQVYERAMASLAGDSSSAVGDGRQINVRTKTRLVVNGKEYASLDEMPADLRRVYDLATKSDGSPVSLVTTLGPALTPQTRWLLLGVLLGAGLMLAAVVWLSGS